MLRSGGQHLGHHPIPAVGECQHLHRVVGVFSQVGQLSLGFAAYFGVPRGWVVPEWFEAVCKILFLQGVTASDTFGPLVTFTKCMYHESL